VQRTHLTSYLVAGALCLAAVLLVAARVYLGSAVVPFDAHDVFAPYYVLVADFARRGQLLLWDPWVNGGLPALAEPQTGSYSPLMITVGLLMGGTWAGFRTYFCVVWWLSGVGTFALGRRLGAPAWGAAIVAFNWVFSGFLLGHAEHVSWVYSMGVLPFAVLMVDLAAERRSLWAFAAAGAIWGLSLFGGYPGIVLNNAAILAAWGLARSTCPPSSWRLVESGLRHRLRFGLAGVLVLAVTGVLVMSPYLLGMIVDARGFTSRAETLSRQVAVGENYLGPLGLLTAASPYLATLSRARLWPNTDISSVSIYIGAATTFLAALALASLRRGRRLAFMLMAVACFAIALGPSLPLRGWLYDYVPVTRMFRHPSMYRGAGCWLLTVLALLGARDMADGRVRRWVPLLVAGICAALAAVAFARLTGIDRGRGYHEARLAFALAWGGVALAAVTFAALGPRLGLSTFVAILAVTAFLDGRYCERVSITHAEEREATLVQAREVDKRHVATLDLGSFTGLDREATAQDIPGLGPYINARNVVTKTPVLWGYSAMKNSFLGPMMRSRAVVRSATGKERVWFSATPVELPAHESVFGTFVARADTLGMPPLFLHRADAFNRPQSPSAQALSAAASAQPVVAVSARLTEYTARTLDFEVVAPADGWLLVTDRWAPGWRASVNGHQTEVRPANFVFRAVPVSKGKNAVAFRYRPLTYPYLVLLSLAVIVIAAIGTRRALRKAKREPKTGILSEPTMETT